MKLRPDQEHLIDLMVAATGLKRTEVIEKWFSTGEFKPIFNCGFRERNAANRRTKTTH